MPVQQLAGLMTKQQFKVAQLDALSSIYGLHQLITESHI